MIPHLENFSTGSHDMYPTKITFDRTFLIRKSDETNDILYRD